MKELPARTHRVSQSMLDTIDSLKLVREPGVLIRPELTPETNPEKSVELPSKAEAWPEQQ